MASLILFQVDLCCVTPATGPSYYRDSLAKLGDTQQANEADAVKVGDRVKVSLDVEILKALSEGHGGWHDSMAQVRNGFFLVFLGQRRARYCCSFAYA